MITCTTSIFKDPNVAKHLSLLLDQYVIVSSYEDTKAIRYLQFTWKQYIYPTTLTKENILENHMSPLCFCEISIKEE